MEIPEYLLNEIREGNVVLFLGAGASRGAKGAQGEEAPLSSDLSRDLAARYLGIADADAVSPLAITSELAASESSVTDVQRFIASKFYPLHPARFHLLVPTFKWAGVATTNFDLVLERAYEQCRQPAQRLVPFITSGEMVEESLRDPSSLPYLKLHGCITRAEDVRTPLILTIDQYVSYRRGREALFKRLKDWGMSHPIVFVGHRLVDPDLRQLLQELGTTEAHRPRYFVVAKDMTEAERRFWEARRISPLEGTFEDFLNMLDGRLDRALRSVALRRAATDHPIAARLKDPEVPLSAALKSLLYTDTEYVRGQSQLEPLDAGKFYKGNAGSWTPIENNLDVRRTIEDDIIGDIILSDDRERPRVSFCLVKGAAGTGKSVFLRRLAWEAAVAYGKLCLYLQPNGSVEYEAIRELSERCGETVYLFVDDVADHAAAIGSLVSRARQSGLPLAVIGAERVNQWRVGAADELAWAVTDEYELRRLSSTEIQSLIELLRRHDCLGRLAGLPHEEQIREFTDRAGRHLLVALHEATLGKPFEEIVYGEYQQIQPELARAIYLSVCVLNQHRTPVRAGIIARVHGVPFEDFRQRFFEPLEQVVFTYKDRQAEDFVYTARHPMIAQMVVERALATAGQRLELYVPMIKALNVEYRTDATALRALLRADAILQDFPEHQMADRVYETAFEEFGDLAGLLHQRGIYEMSRPSGNLTRAGEFLTKANRAEPHNSAFLHSLAELEYRKAEVANSVMETEVHLTEADRIARRVTGPAARTSHGYHTMAKVGLLKLERLIWSPSKGLPWEINQVIKETESAIDEGLQRFPDQSYLFDAAARLGELLLDSNRAKEALGSGNKANPYDPYIATRLARVLGKEGRLDDALRVCNIALDANPSDKRLHFCAGELSRDSGEEGALNAEWHFRRAYTQGDRNYEARYWYARQAYVNGKTEEAREVFRELRDAPLDPEFKRQVRGVIAAEGTPRLFTGTVERLESTYAFIRRDGQGDQVFVHIDNASPVMWERLGRGRRVKFRLGFNFSGPAAIELEMEGHE